MAVFKSKEKTKDGRQWYFKCYKKNENGENVAFKSKKFATKKEAEEEEAIYILKRDNPRKKNFHLVSLEYLKYSLTINRESTVQSYKYQYEKHIKPYFYKKDIDIEIQDYKKWVEIINDKGFSLSFKNRLYSLFKNILNFAMKNYNLEKNVAQIYGPFKSVNSEVIYDDNKLRYITIEEFNQFISVIDDDLWYTFFNFLFYTGCRKSEVFALVWNDIDFINNQIRINKTVSRSIENDYTIVATKNSKNRKIEMNKALRDVLIKHKNKQMLYNDYSDEWFVFGNTIPMSRTTADRHKQYYFKLSGIKEITMHEFRHSCVTYLINKYIEKCKKTNAKIDMTKFFLILSNRMGHSVEVMMRTYMHLVPTIQDEIVDLFDDE